MVEFDERPVAELVCRQVIVSDVIGVEATPERTRAFIAVRGQPLSVGLHLFTNEDRRKGAWYPPRFKGVGSVDSGAHLPEPELLTGFNDGGLDCVAFLPGAKQFQSGYAGHAMVQGADFSARDGYFT